MYSIVTLCQGCKYEPILPHWIQRIRKTCKNSNIHLVKLPECDVNFNIYAWWDYVRMQYIINLLKDDHISVHCDIDVIIEKDIEPLIALQYDIIISKEIGGPNAFPKEYSSLLGFGICTGFYIVKSPALAFLQKILTKMKTNAIDKSSYSDQVALMETFVNSTKTIYNETLTLDGKKYTNIVIEIDGIKICVLDFDIVVRDPIKNNGQYANHINIDNVGGTHMLIEYFYKDFEDLPITCRCGKTWLGDFNVCPHLSQR